MLNPSDRPRDNLGAGKRLAQRCKNVTGIDGARTDLREERVIGQIGPRIYDGDRDIRSERLTQMLCCGQAD